MESTLFTDDLQIVQQVRAVTPAPSATIPTAPSVPARPTIPPASAPLGPTVLAVDGNSLAHRGYHAYAAHRDSGDLVGAGLYGFLALLAAVVDIVRPAATVIGLDCRRRSWRKECWPPYKAHRADKADALDALLDEIPVVLDQLGAYVVCREGFEADDVCGSVAAAAEAARRRCIVATSDRDAYALISHATSVLRIRSGMHRAQLIDDRRLRRDLGIDPGQYTEFSALRGDTSDNLPGIHGVGRKRARDLLRRFHTVTDAVDDPLACRSVLGPEVGQTLIDDVSADGGVFARNVELMTLRRDLPVDLDAGVPRTPLDRIDAVLRRRRLAGLIARMSLCFGAVGESAGDDGPPPLGDADAPPLELD